MTRSVRPAFLVLVLAASPMLLPTPAPAQKLDDEDKAFLRDVQPIILIAEKSTYEKLKDKAERLEFQRIFWARRDPDLATPENEFQQQYLKDRAFAEESYSVGTRAGSATDCGRTYILLGRPEQVQPRPGVASVRSEGGTRVAEVWVYIDRPDRRIRDGKIMVLFDSNCAADGDFAQQFPRMAASKIVHAEIDYKTDKDGRLVKLADQLPRGVLTLAMLRQPRQDFALAVQPAYLRTAGGRTAVLGLVEGDASGLTTAGGDAVKTIELSVAASARSADGRTAGSTEQTMKVPVAANGRFLASFRLRLEPGQYTLHAGALDLRGDKGSVVSTPIDVPEFGHATAATEGGTKPGLAGTVLVVKDIEQVAANAPADAADPLAAFRLNTTQLIPVFTASLRKSDSVMFFFQLYGLHLDATGRANGSVRLKLTKEGAGPLHTSGETPFQAADFSSAVGPIPLAGFPPGKYMVEIEATDKIAQKTVTLRASFEIQP
jgi:GWxTD domain-containing protein